MNPNIHSFLCAQDGHTALMLATIHSELDMVKQLIHQKATIDLENEVLLVAILTCNFFRFE